MNRNFYHEAKRWIIYTVQGPGDKIFIGKSSAQSVKPLFLAHRRGENRYTRELFTGDGTAHVLFHVLEVVVCTAAEAYKHVVCWSYFYSQHGYKLLMAAGTINASNNLLPETREIYDEICAPYTWADVQLRSVTVLPELPMKTEKRSVKKTVTLRLDEKTAEEFRVFCNENDLTQNEGLKLLMFTREGPKDRASEIVEEVSEKAKSKALLVQRRAWVQVLRQFVKCLLGNSVYEGSQAKIYPFRHAKEHLEFDTYKSLEGYGSVRVRMEAAVWGKGNYPPVHLLCVDEAGNRIKFRYYTRSDFVGVSPKTYGEPGSHWLFGYIAAKDGAAELICAIPLEWLNKNEVNETNRYTSVDDIIKDAERRLEECDECI